MLRTQASTTTRAARHAAESPGPLGIHGPDAPPPPSPSGASLGMMSQSLLDEVLGSPRHAPWCRAPAALFPVAVNTPTPSRACPGSGPLTSSRGVIRGAFVGAPIPEVLAQAPRRFAVACAARTFTFGSIWHDPHDATAGRLADCRHPHVRIRGINGAATPASLASAIEELTGVRPAAVEVCRRKNRKALLWLRRPEEEAPRLAEVLGQDAWMTSTCIVVAADRATVATLAGGIPNGQMSRLHVTPPEALSVPRQVPLIELPPSMQCRFVRAPIHYGSAVSGRAHRWHDPRDPGAVNFADHHPPHVLLTNIAYNVAPASLAEALRVLTGAEPVAVAVYVHNGFGKAVVWLRHPALIETMVCCLNHRAWMSGTFMIAVANPQDLHSTLDLSTFVSEISPGSRMPRRLITCEAFSTAMDWECEEG